MVDEGHLAAAELALAEPLADVPWYSEFGLDEALILQQSWIAEHVPNLTDVSLEPLVRSESGLFERVS